MSEPLQTTESVVEEPVVVEKEKSPLAEQFQRIAKQEKFVASERQKIEESKKAFEADKQFADNYKQLKGKDPFEILEHFGISYEQLVEIDKKRKVPVDPMQKRALDEIAKLRNDLQAEKSAVEQNKIAKAEVQLKADIDLEIKNNEYDLIEKLQAKDAVREYMEEIYNTTGEIPTVKEACEAVTNYLVEQYSSVRESKWLKPKEVVVQPIEVVKKSEVISNKMTQTSEHSNKPLSEADRIKAAVAIMASMSKS